MSKNECDRLKKDKKAFMDDNGRLNDMLRTMNEQLQVEKVYLSRY